MKNIAKRATKKAAARPPTEHPLAHAGLVEYLAARVVTELLVSEFEQGTYRLEVSLSWKTGKSVLMAARGDQRTFRSLDTMASFLKSVGIGSTVVRMELKP